MLTVACVLKSGGDYSAEYVERLQAGVVKHMDADHRFVCLSDAAVPCERVPLLHDWPGFWSKLELFRIPGPVVYFDLDTVIQGPLAFLAGAGQGLTMLRDLGTPTRLASGVLVWRGDVERHYLTFKTDVARHVAECSNRRYWGDGGYMHKYCEPNRQTLQDLKPGAIVSRKYATRAAIDAAAIVCFHGQPRPHNVAWQVHR